MPAKFIIRFDDICPTMNWETWTRIEQILDSHDIKPILAVVPDNHDATLSVGRAREDFWECVRTWQQKGWSIGLHGFQHVYTTDDGGLIGLNSRSEFAGLSSKIQQEKIERALSIFKKEGIHPEAWIAPGHSFDAETIRALVKNGITIISDGFFSRIVKNLGVIWVPQQIWRFHLVRKGTWTVCYHHNSWTETELLKLENDIKNYKSQIHTLRSLLDNIEAPTININDRLFSVTWLYLIRTKRFLKKISTSNNIIGLSLRFLISMVH